MSTTIKEKKFRIFFTLKDGTSTSMLVPAKDKDSAIQEVRNVWYGYNPQIKQVKVEK